jgi:hypothetical protein
VPSFPIGAVTVTTTLCAACHPGPQVSEGKPTRTAGAQRRGADAARQQHCRPPFAEAHGCSAGLRHVDERAAHNADEHDRDVCTVACTVNGGQQTMRDPDSPYRENAMTDDKGRIKLPIWVVQAHRV